MTRTPRPLTLRLRAAVTVAALVVVASQCSGDSEPAAAKSPKPQEPAAKAAAPAAVPEIVGERLTLLLSGSMLGRLEPCGCASGQLGGLPRRLTHILEAHGADLLLEGGDLTAGNTQLDLEKALTAVNVLFGLQPETRYDALGVGPTDLQLPLAEWGALLQQFATPTGSPIIASDLVPAADSPLQPSAFVEKDVRGTKVRVVSLTMRLPPLPAGTTLPLQLLAPADGWRRGLEGAAENGLRILMVHDAPDRVRALARELQPRPDLAIGIDDTYHEPPAAAELQGEVPVVFPGIRGRHLVAVELGRTRSGAALPRYEVVPLRGSDTKPDAGQDPAARKLIRDHRMWVAEQKLREAMADHAPTPNGQAYVGTPKCGSCHQEDLQRWQNSKHANAWKTLATAEADPKRYGWPVTKYPDCVGCHVVGYREKSGFVNPEQTPDLMGVGCEQCHGPGEAHSKDPKVAKMGRVGDGTPSLVCARCHDFEQSPDFLYGTRWPLIEHGKKLK